MKKSILLVAFMLASVGMIAQTTLKAQSLYDVNQDDQVSISDVNTVAKKVVENAATDKTVVDTEALLTVLNKLSSDIALIKAKLGIEDEAEDTHEYVDLGLPSGTLWATCNIGAENPEDYGLYFAWGETTGYTSDTSDGHQSNWANYKWCNGSYSTLTKYCTDSSYGTVDDKTELESADDAATANWGSKWCMPTDAQLTELRTECTWTWDADKKGYTVSKNGKSIFLPAAGYRYDSSLNTAGSNGYYWSRSLNSSYPCSAWVVYFYSDNVYRISNNRCYGQSVRAVRSE